MEYFEYIKSEEGVFKEIKNWESEIFLSFFLSLLRLLQLCDSDFISFRCWFAWDSVLESLARDLHSNIFMSAVIQGNCSYLNQVYKTSQNACARSLHVFGVPMYLDDYDRFHHVVKFKYPTHPLSQLELHLIRTSQNIVHLDSMVELSPTSFVGFCIYKVS